MLRKLFLLAIATASTGCAAMSTEVHVSYQSGGAVITTSFRR